MPEVRDDNISWALYLNVCTPFAQSCRGECLHAKMYFVGLICVGSSPPTDYRRASEAVVIASEPVQTDRPGGTIIIAVACIRNALLPSKCLDKTWLCVAGDSGRVNDIVPANTSMTPYIRSRHKRSGNRGSRKCRQRIPRTPSSRYSSSSDSLDDDATNDAYRDQATDGA